MAGGSSNLDHVPDRASQQIGLIRAGKFQRPTWSRLRAGAPETNDARSILHALKVVITVLLSWRGRQIRKYGYGPR
jgi:hypothetical protein